MSELKCVLFDIDDTLFSTTVFARRARSHAVRAMVQAGLDLDEETVLAELAEVIREVSSNDGRHFDRLIQRLGPHHLGNTNPAVVIASGVVAYHDTKRSGLQPFDDVVPVLASIRSAGLRTGVITHGRTIKQAEKLVRLGLLPYFDPDAIFISDQLGISKPNPKLYRAALRALALQPDQVVYVGDNPVRDIAPAVDVGITAVWARRASKYSLDGTGIVPDHIIDDFEELATLLRAHFDVDLN